MELSKLKEIRKSHKLSIQEVSKRCGLDRNLVTSIESGSGNPTWKNVMKVCEALGFELNLYYVGREE